MNLRYANCSAFCMGNLCLFYRNENLEHATNKRMNFANFLCLPTNLINIIP
ncbi:hypothetical protein Hanom_Chr10g00876381 [Helianthus anomalus]